MRILLLEDTPDVAEAIMLRFRQRGDAVDWVASVRDAEDYLRVQSYDLAILDIGLPDGAGTDVLKTLRKGDGATPVLMLTARGEIEDRVEALDLGADDYLVKPFDLRELEARARALQRRMGGDVSVRLEFGDVSLDVAGGIATAGANTLDLTRRELSVLKILLENQRRIVSKDALFDRMFSFEDEPANINAVEIQVGRLRRKLEGTGVTIKTLRGLGYQLIKAV